jgi:phage gp46-like protein
MDYLVTDGNYEKTTNGDFETVTGVEEKKQQIYISLIIPLGSFIFDKNLGSRLYELLREKNSVVDAHIGNYTRDALKPVADIEINDVAHKWMDKGKLYLIVYFIYNGISDSMEVVI